MDLNALLFCARMVKRRKNPSVVYLCCCPWQCVVLLLLVIECLCGMFFFFLCDFNDYGSFYFWNAPPFPLECQPLNVHWGLHMMANVIPQQFTWLECILHFFFAFGLQIPSVIQYLDGDCNLCSFDVYGHVFIYCILVESFHFYYHDCSQKKKKTFQLSVRFWDVLPNLQIVLHGIFTVYDHFTFLVLMGSGVGGCVDLCA
jgi:hypothetical protein